MKSDWAKNGYVIVRDCFWSIYLAGISEVLRSALIDSPRERDANLELLLLERESVDHGRVYNAGLCVGSSFYAQRLTGNSRLSSSLDELLGVNPWHLHLMPLHVAVQMPNDPAYLYLPHTESSFYPSIKNIVNVWFPIHRASTKEGGTIGVIPGSHLRGQRKSNQERGASGFLQVVAELEPGESERTIPIEIGLGDALIFHADLVHSSYPNHAAYPRLNGILRVVNMADQKSVRPLYKALSWGE